MKIIKKLFPVGTRSVLFGAHCFFIHPIFVFIAWWKLYGFPFDPRLWVAFFVHDLGYFGKPNMDGKEGETHVEFGAKIMHFFDGWHLERQVIFKPNLIQYERLKECGWFLTDYTIYTATFKRFVRKWKWSDFSKYHSRFYAKRDAVQYSKLCVSDKYAICLEPYWFYIIRVMLSGEIKEYMNLGKNNDSKYGTMGVSAKSRREWFNDVVNYLVLWVGEHKELKKDTWTPKTVPVITEKDS